MGLWVFIVGSVVSLPLIPLFLAWSLPGAARLGLPKRSIGGLCLLIAYHPFRLYLEGQFFDADELERIANLHERFPIVWALKHLDTALLAGLALWAIRRRTVAQLNEKVWFHWLLFVCALWAVIALSDSAFGYFAPYIFTFFFPAPQS